LDRGRLNKKMNIEDIGLGSVILTGSDGEPITVRLSIAGESFRISLMQSDTVIAEAYMDEESDVSDLITLLESCFKY